MPEMAQTTIAAAFSCLGGDCPDTCCKGWGMQVDAATVAKYAKEAPELLDDVVEGEAAHVMRRDPETDYCVRFGDDGWCTIHQKHGETMLGDACHFYPRVTRAIDKHATVMTLAPSCPEALRLALTQAAPFARESQPIDRLPNEMRHYTEEGLSGAEMLAVHDAFIAGIAADDSISAGRHLLRSLSVVESMDFMPKESWAEAAAFYLKMADSRLPKAGPAADDVLKLFSALVGLIAAAKPSKRAPLERVVQLMADALKLEFQLGDAQPTITPETAAALDALNGLEIDETVNQMLKRWLAMQFSTGFFPFAGLGENPMQRAIIIGVRLATLQLALKSYHSANEKWPDENAFILLAQPLSRFLDHLADPTLSLMIYEEIDWVRPARLAGLLIA